MHNLPFAHRRALIDAGALIGTLIFAQFIFFFGSINLADYDGIASDLNHLAVLFSQNDLARISHSFSLHAGRDQRYLWAQ